MQRSSASAQTPTAAETGLLLADGLLGLDAARANAFADLAPLSSAKATSLRRERAILARKYGEKDERVVHLDTRIERQTGFQRDLNLAHVLAATPLPAADEKSYVFHGFVRNRSREPQPGLTVALYDAKGTWVRELGYQCTDEHGYFLFRHAAAGNARTETTAEEAAKLAKESDLHAIGKRIAFEIRVYDAKQNLLHREAEPLLPAPGQVDFRTIIIGGDGCSCGAPPGAEDSPPPIKPAPQAPAPAPQPAAVVSPPERPAPFVAAPVKTATSTPLEDIKGIGPAIAKKLRAAGIPDLEAFLATPGEKLVEIAGFDAKVIERHLAEARRLAATPHGNEK